MKKARLEVFVGLFVILAFILLSVIVFSVSGIYFFRPGYNLTAVFDFVGIINTGAPVRYAGVKVGEVKEVEIIDSIGHDDSGNVRVTFFVVDGVHIYEHDQISVQGTYIMSEPHIAIEPVKDRGRLLTGGDVVKGISPISTDVLIRRGEKILNKIDGFLEQMGSTFGGPENMKVLSETFYDLHDLIASMNQIVKGEEEQYREGLIHLSRSAEKLSDFVDNVNSTEGTVGRLINDDELYNEMLEFVKEIKRHPWRLLKKK